MVLPDVLASNGVIHIMDGFPWLPGQQTVGGRHVDMIRLVSNPRLAPQCCCCRGAAIVETAA